MEDDPLRFYRKPADDSAEKFLKFEYPETKDLCKQFLTLITGVLAFSVTFSEKIVPVGARHFRILLVISWFLFLVAFVGTGVGLYQIFRGRAESDPRAGQYTRPELQLGTFLRFTEPGRDGFRDRAFAADHLRISQSALSFAS